VLGTVADIGIIKQDIGTFKGFAESGLEFTAEIVAPYHTEYRPNIGEFLIVTLGPENAVLGRITRFYPMGVLSSGEGDEYLAEMRRRQREIPEDLKETKLRYTVNVKLLGGIEVRGKKFLYHPSIRQLPHLGARVGTLSNEALRYVCSLGKGEGHSVPIGHYSIGETVFAGEDAQLELPVMFDLDHLIARRTYVFARAGYGKTNLIKLLTARLYELSQPGGMVIFDPEGEYAFRDKKGRPGLADVPFLAEKLIVYTNRRIPKPSNRWVAGDVRLNLCDLRPSEVVNQCVAEGKQEAVFANVLRGLDDTQWAELVHLIARDSYRADNDEIARITRYDANQQSVVIAAIKNNLTPVVSSLHSDDSDLIRSIRGHLGAGRIVVIDISLLSTTNGYRVSGLILTELFHRNQENFIAGSEGAVLPVIAVIEEAQSILPKGVSDTSPFVTWVKEGRKYSLGAILVTQQPGSIAPELLSQGDNFFAFHLLSVGDLKSLQGHNAHYSNDILASILNEPIKGNAYIWSAPDQPFVLPCRINNFESWAEGLKKSTKADMSDFRTPAEIQRLEQPKKLRRLDELVRQVIERQSSVPLNSIQDLDGQKVENSIAVKQWNLLFAVGELIAPDDDLFVEFGENLPTGKRALRGNVCIDSLNRLALFIAKATDENGTKYYVLDGKTIERKRKPSNLKLMSNTVGSCDL
jgi:uncharacterized protein